MWLSKSSAKIAVKMAQEANQPLASPRQVDRQTSLLLGFFRSLFPCHAMGRDPAYHARVQARVDASVAAFKAQNPEATEGDIKSGSIARLCQARKDVFEELPEDEQAWWRERAKKSRASPGGDEDE